MCVCKIKSYATDVTRTLLIAIILVRNQPWCSQRYPESRCVLARPLNSLITTHSRLPYSLPSSISLSLSLFPADTLLTWAISSVLPPPYPFCPPPSRALTGSFTYHGFHAGSHPESGYDSVVLSRFSLRGPFLLLLSRSLVLDRSLRWCSASPLTPSPPLPRTLFPPYRTVVYISRGSFAHHRLAAVLASRESEFLPAAPPFLAFSLRLYLPLSFHLWPPSVLSGFLRRLSYPPDIYVYSRTFRFNSFRRTRIFPSPPPSPFPPLLSPSSFCSLWFRESTFERSVSLSPLYLFLPGSRHTRSPRSFCPVPFHHRCRAAVPSLTPFAARPSSPRLFALLYRAAIPPLPPLPHLPLLPSRLRRAPSSFPCRSFAHGF